MLHSASLSAISYCLFCSFLKVSHAIDNISYISHHSLSPFIAHSLVLLLLYARLIHYYYHTSFALLFVAIVRVAHFIYLPVSVETNILRLMNHFGPTDAHRAAERPAALLSSYFFLACIISYWARGFISWCYTWHEGCTSYYHLHVIILNFLLHMSFLSSLVFDYSILPSFLYFSHYSNIRVELSPHCYLIFYCRRSDLSWPDWHCWWFLWFSASYRLFLLVQVAAIFFPSNLCSCGLIRGSLLLPLPFREAEFYHGFDPSPRRILQRNWYVPRTRVRREWETYWLHLPRKSICLYNSWFALYYN